MASQTGRNASRGFTLIELVIAITVIAILAAIMVPTILGVIENSRRAAATESLAELAKTMKRFHDDTGYWPQGDTVWVPQPGGSVQVSPSEFTTNDTVMFKGEPPDVTSITVNGEPLQPLGKCLNTQPGYSCFNGPYLGKGDSLGGTEMRDPWGNPFRYMYIRPFDGSGGYVNFQNGFVAIWSCGPDRKDGTGCFSTSNAGSDSCAYDLSKIAFGKPSKDGADDIVRFVGGAL